MSAGAEVRKGIGDSWTVALGLIPLGLAFGLLMTQIGFAWWWTPVFSIVIYAGSMEFLAISLVTGGVAPLSALLYGFLVNFRHIFYGLSYPVSAVRGPVAKAYGIYSLTDETYAILTSKRAAAWTQPRVIAVQLFCQLSWVVPGIIGALAGSALPFELEGLDFALTALFVVLAIEAMDCRPTSCTWWDASSGSARRVRRVRQVTSHECRTSRGRRPDQHPADPRRGLRRDPDPARTPLRRDALLPGV